MKNSVKNIVITICGFLGLTLIKMIILLILIFTDDNFYYSSVQNNIDYSNLAIKLICLHAIPIIIYLIMGSYFVYQYLKKTLKTIIIVSISIFLYYIFDFIRLFYFIENHIARVIWCIVLLIVLLTLSFNLLKNYKDEHDQ